MLSQPQLKHLRSGSRRGARSQAAVKAAVKAAAEFIARPEDSTCMPQLPMTGG